MICNVLLRGSIVGCSLLAVSLASPRLAQDLPSEESVRQQFRDFYEPLLPRLKASYQTFHYRCAFVYEQPDLQRVTFAKGAVRETQFTFDRYPPVSLRESLTIERLREDLETSDQPEASGGWLGEYSFTIAWSNGQKTLNVRHDRPLPKAEFEPVILAPLCSIQLLRTYESLMGDADCQMIDFTKRRLRTGQRVYTLFYRPPGFPDEIIFEADFDPQTGACVSSQEFERNDPDWPNVTRLTYADIPLSDAGEAGRSLPAPAVIRGNFRTTQTIFVLDYRCDPPPSPEEFSVAWWGFDPSLTERPQLLPDHVVRNARRLLLVAGLVLLLLFMFVLLLMLVISRVAGKHAARPGASDSGP
jgi:hypothetical protein